MNFLMVHCGYMIKQESKKKTIIVVVVGALSLLYLLNPGFGLFELIPDNIPLLGNMDEGLATFLLLSALAYFGLDLRDVFMKFPKNK